MSYKYIEKIREILDVVEVQEKDSIDQSILVLTEAILNKRSIYAFGASHAGMLTQELFFRAGGLMTINPIFAKELACDNTPITITSQFERLVGFGTILAQKVDFKPQDVLIVHSVSGRNAVSIELAMAAKNKGVTVIGVTNLTQSKLIESRHPSGMKLYELCDIVLDNHGEIGDACVEIDGLKQKVSASSTVIGATILNTVVSQTVQALVDRGLQTPPIFYSANIDGGEELNQALYEQYKDNIKYQY